MAQLTFDDAPVTEVEAEIWLPVVGHEGLYEISSLGQVKSLPRNTTPGGLMQLQLRDDGHLTVTLTCEGIQAHRAVHQLVAEAFIGPRPAGQEVCHNNGKPACNSVSNLRWDTHRENNLDRGRHGTDHNLNKTHCPRGHEYSPENTEIRQYPNGPRRFCLACRKINARQNYERRRELGLEPAWKPNSELTAEQVDRRRQLAAARQRVRRRKQRDAGQ